MSDNRRAVAEEEGESNGGCSGSAVGMDRASSHVLSSSGEGGGGGAGGGGGGGSTSLDTSGWVRAVTSTIKIKLMLDNTLPSPINAIIILVTTVCLTSPLSYQMSGNEVMCWIWATRCAVQKVEG